MEILLYMILHNPTKIFFLNREPTINTYTISNEDLYNLNQIVFIENNQILYKEIHVTPTTSFVDQPELNILYKLTKIKAITLLDHATLYMKYMKEKYDFL